jgi:hypothetical protein
MDLTIRFHCILRDVGTRSLLVWAALAVIGGGAASADIQKDVQAMTHLVRVLRYEEAVERGLRALRGATPADRPELPALYRELASAYFSLGDEPHARGALVQLFALDPDAQPPAAASPRMRALFDRVRLESAGVALDPVPLSEVSEGRPVAFEVRVQSAQPREVRILLHHRIEGAGAYQTRVLERQGDRWVATLPPLLLATGTARSMEYWVEAQDQMAQPLAQSGTEAAPLRARVMPQPIAPPPSPPPADTTPVYRKGWFWAVVGAVAITGVATAIYLGARSSNPGLDVCVGFQNAPCPR